MAQVLICSKLAHSFWLEIVKPNPNKDANWPMPVDPNAPRVEIKGSNSLRLTETEPSQSGFRFAQTPVDESLWREWLKINKDLKFVRDGFVFEAASLQEAKGKAKERVDERTGLEPLQADGSDPRLKSVNTTPKFEPGVGLAV